MTADAVTALPTASLDEKAITNLATHLRGDLIQPGDAGYDAARA